MKLNTISSLALLSLLLASGYSQDASSSSSSAAGAETKTAPASDETPSVEEAAKPVEVEEEEDPVYMEADPASWGTYYDPQQEFCGKFDCYRILGFDYESFGAPDTKLITKRYRKLSRKWHPDKSKHPKAKERFVKISRAYETLTSNEKRKEYDMMRYNQEAYFQKYGTSVVWSFAPKSDVTSIVIILLILVNVFSWFAQKTKWQNVADRLVKAAVEEWSPSQGGSPESKELREHALAILAERESENNGSEANNGEDKNGTPGKKSKSKKVSGKDRKKQENEALIPILKELVGEMHDFGAGFHKPTWEDLVIVSLAKLPFKIVVGTAWEMKYYARRLQGKELNEEEKQVLTERAVGPVTWDIASDEAREELIKGELWIKENLIEFKEEEEIKNLSAADQKAYRKAMKAEKKKAKQS